MQLARASILGLLEAYTTLLPINKFQHKTLSSAALLLFILNTDVPDLFGRPLLTKRLQEERLWQASQLPALRQITT